MQTNSFEQSLPIEENEIAGKVVQTVSARDLYTVLGLATSQFSRWIKKNLLDNSYFIENKDFLIHRHNVDGLRKNSRGIWINEKGKVVEIEDYQITIEVAKHLSMLSRSKKAHEIRNYFIRIEETFLQLVGLKSKSEAEMHLFKNLDNIDLILKDMDTMNSVFEKLETAHKFLNTKNILELYRMDKFTQKIMNFSIFEVFGINLNEMFFIPTELGKILDRSAVEINKILEHKGYQIKVDEQWELTEKGKKFAIEVKNKLFTQIKWRLEAIA